MSKQLSFFETNYHDGNHSVKVARKSDKTTSHKAAASVDLKGKRKIFYDTLAGWSDFPRTANEVAAKAIPIDGSKPVLQVFKARETLRKRAGELVKLGLIRECQARPCKINGNEATTYEVV